MEAILGGLATLHVTPRPVLGERTNVLEAEKKTKASLVKSAERVGKNGSKRDAEGSTPAGRAAKSKAVLLADLSSRAAKATDNEALSSLVQEYVKVLQMNSSRTLTKEASRFLDTLYKQLDDPSVFVQPTRYALYVFMIASCKVLTGDCGRLAKTRSMNEGTEPAHAKLAVVTRLRMEVRTASNNKAIGNLVAEFTKITNKSIGRTITKDGFMFLEGVSKRLSALH